MTAIPEFDYEYLPGLFRLWDLAFVLCPGRDWQVEYAQDTEDGVPLFSVSWRTACELDVVQ